MRVEPMLAQGLEHPHSLLPRRALGPVEPVHAGVLVVDLDEELVDDRRQLVVLQPGCTEHRRGEHKTDMLGRRLQYIYKAKTFVWHPSLGRMGRSAPWIPILVPMVTGTNHGGNRTVD